MSLDPLSPDNTLPENSHVAKWCSTCEDGMGKIGLSLKIRKQEEIDKGEPGYDLAHKMKEKGFVNITVREFKVSAQPSNPLLDSTKSHCSLKTVVLCRFSSITLLAAAAQSLTSPSLPSNRYPSAPGPAKSPPKNAAPSSSSPC